MTRRAKALVSIFVAASLSVSAGSSIAASSTIYPKKQTLALGWANACAVTTGLFVKCWGADDLLITEVPNDLGKVLSLSLGTRHVCAIKVSGELRCWGRDGYSEPGITPEPNDPQNDVPTNLGKVRQVYVSGEDYLTCVVTSKSLVRCWGDASSPVARVPKNFGKVTSISLGQDHACAITLQKRVKCWGKDSYVQGKSVGKLEAPKSLENVVQVVANLQNSCALTRSGKVKCWGRAGLLTKSSLTGVYQISSYGAELCLISKKTLSCHSNSEYSDPYYDYAQGTWEQKKLKTVTVLSKGVQYVQLETGSGYLCGVTTSGSVKCFGKDYRGRMRVPAGMERIK